MFHFLNGTGEPQWYPRTGSYYTVGFDHCGMLDYKESHHTLGNQGHQAREMLGGG